MTMTTEEMASKDVCNITYRMATEQDWNDFNSVNKVKVIRARYVGNTGYPFIDCSYWHVENPITKEIVSVNGGCLGGDYKKMSFKSDLYKEAKKSNIFWSGLFANLSVLVI